MTLYLMTPALASQAISGSNLRLGLRGWLMLGVALSVCPFVASAQALPQGATVTSGDVSITSQGGSSMTITQGTQTGIVNWNSFSVGAGSQVVFQQPNATSSTLNRVTGATQSNIHGSIQANGTVHLVNPNGIFIGANGSVDAGSFSASTLNITDEDYNAGRLRYSGLGTSASVENAGRVTIGRGGYAALIGGKVRNSGIITVPMGRIGFAAGERVTLDVSGDQFLQVTLPSGGEDDGEALIDNSGTVRAEGGLIEMRAATARHAARNAINLSGVAEARSVSVRNGAIVLGGGGGGTVKVSGRVSTRSKPARIVMDTSPRPPKAPSIDITGTRIALAGAQIDASGTDGGGTIRIGGDYQGHGPLPRAQTLTGDAGTQINVDALAMGDGGKLALWSDLQTDFAGRVSARGGPDGGDGGFIEVSGKSVLNYTGWSDTRAPLGSWGSLLLDPEDITINAAEAIGLADDLTRNNIVLNTFNDGASDAGNITINADVEWTQPTSLTLVADNNVNINASVVASSGALIIDADADYFVGSTSTIGVDRFELSARNAVVSGTFSETGGTGGVNTDSFRLDEGTWSQAGPDLSGFQTRDFTITSGSDFFRIAGGTGSVGDPYLIPDIYSLQGLNSSVFSGANFELPNDINAATTSGWDSGRGLVPLQNLEGTFDGAGFAITDLNITPFDDGGSSPAALFRSIGNAGTVTDLFIEGATNISGTSAGILAVTNAGTIRNSGVSGTVTSEGSRAGGLVARNFGTIEDSFADVAVTLNANFDLGFEEDLAAGGFVGANFGTINRSHSVGAVTFNGSISSYTYAAGGFVGQSLSGTINDSYAQGAVSVVNTGAASNGIDAGGFAGTNFAGINRSYSTGSVTAAGPGTINAGGFVGFDDSSSGASTNFWDTDTSGQGTSALGTGLTTAQFQDTAAFFALGTDAGWDFGAVWAPGDTGEYPENFTTSDVIFVQPDSFEVQYGLTDNATTTGTVSGGPDAYVFDDPTDSLDTSGVFDEITFADNTAGEDRAFTLDITSLNSALNEPFRVVSLPGSATITQAPLTISTLDQTKVYGETFVFNGDEFGLSDVLFFSDSIDSVTLTSTGSGNTAGINGGVPYQIEASNPTGFRLENYDIAFANTGGLTVTQAPLTITANDRAKTYGETVVFDGTEFTEAGLLNLDSITSVDLASAGAINTAEVNSGVPYDISASNAVGVGLDNYAIDFVAGNLTVNPADLSIFITDANKVYGDLLPFNGSEFTTSGLLAISTDSIDSLTITSDGAAQNAEVGTGSYVINGTDPVGSRLDNYNITIDPGALLVARADLVIRPDDQTKLQGDEIIFDGTEFSTRGLIVTEDSVDLVQLNSDGAAADALAADSPFDIIASSESGNRLENYNVSFELGTLIIDLPEDTGPAIPIPPTFVGFPIANPTDSIGSLFGGSVDGDTGSVEGDSPASVSGSITRNNTITKSKETLAQVETLSSQLTSSSGNCGTAGGDVNRYLSCLSDSLNSFGSELDEISADLPPGMQNVARIVQDARVQVDQVRARARARLATATTDAQRAAIGRDAVNEARGVVANAAGEIRKSISLVRADDPELATVQRATISTAATALDNVGTQLSRVAEL